MCDSQHILETLLPPTVEASASPDACENTAFSPPERFQDVRISVADAFSFFDALTAPVPCFPCVALVQRAFDKAPWLRSADSFGITLSVAPDIDSLYDEWQRKQDVTRTPLVDNDGIHNGALLTPSLPEKSLKERCRVHFRAAVEHVCSSLRWNSEAFAFTVSVTLKWGHFCSVEKLRKRKKFKQAKGGHSSAATQPQEGLPFTQSVCHAHFVHLSFIGKPIIVQGRYLKFKRHISQTKWLASPVIQDADASLSEDNGSALANASVEEYICEPLNRVFKSSHHNFHAAGREDADVRMLGTGRPFMVVLQDCRIFIPNSHDEHLAFIQRMEKAINDHAIPCGVSVNQLSITLCERQGPHAAYKDIQQLAEEKDKVYGCICYSPYQDLTLESMEKLLNQFGNEANGFINQKTPVRVLHRRSLLIRTKRVWCQNAELLTPRLFALKLITDAGTYVKEFIHGDFNRTSSSVSSTLGTPVSLLQLDVLGLRLRD